MTLPPATFVSQRFRSAAGPPLTLASDLTVPLAEGRLLAPASGEPDRGVPCRLDLAMVSRAPLPTDPPMAVEEGRPGIGAAVLVRPCLHTPVDLAALRAAHAQRAQGGPAAEADAVLLPRPEGRFARVPERLSAGWRDARPQGVPRRAGVVRLRETLVEHPGWAEREVFGPRAQGRPLADDWSRPALLADPGAAGATASPPSLAGELAMLCPDGNTKGQRTGARGQPAAAAPRFALSMLAAAWARGDRRPEVERAVQDWVGASPAWQAQVAAALRQETRVGLRDLWPRTDGCRRRIRSIRPALVEVLGCTFRPFPAELVWGRGGVRTEAALVATAELLWSARWSPWLVETLMVAAGGALDRARWLWGDGSFGGFTHAVKTDGFSVAQVVVPTGHPLHRPAVGALDLPDPRGKQQDWRGRWACPVVRLKQSKQALSAPVRAVLAGPATTPLAVAQAVWGCHDWPLAFGARLGAAAQGVA